MEDTKFCCRCKNVKDVKEFNKGKRSRMGLHNHCRTCQKEIRRAWFLKNRESELQKSAIYSKTEEAKIGRKLFYEKHKERLKEKQNIRRKLEPAKIKQRINEKLRRENNPSFKIAKNLRSRLRVALKNSIKSDSTINLLGCSIEICRKHLESKFLPGMNWENYGIKGWHIDHIKPCASFDLTNPEQQKICFHYTNLQPLWAKDNIAKSDKF